MSVSIVVTSHGQLAEGALSAYHMLAGADDNVCAVCLTDAGVEDFRARLQACVSEKLALGNVLILADLQGGTPYNESYALFLEHTNSLRVVAGVNLPMLLSIGLEARDANSLDELIALALETGAQGVLTPDLPTDAKDIDANAADDDLF